MAVAMRKPPPIAIAYIFLFGCTVLLLGHVVLNRHHLSELSALANQDQDRRIPRNDGGVVHNESGLGRGGSGEENDRASSDSIRNQVTALLNISVPITLDKECLTSSRAAVGFSCGETHVVRFKGYADLPKRNLSRVLPDLDLFRGVSYDSCAVVGNSGTLLESELGEEIDAHAVVIRFNGGITEGYEQFVGTKTTFRILNRPDSASPSTEAGEVTIATVRDHQLRTWVRSVIEHPERSDSSYVFDPEFLCYCWSWVGNKGHKPSSGLVGLVMALKTCKTTTLFGFSSSSYFSDTSRPHYFDWERPAKGREGVHPFQHEQKLYQHLKNLGIINIKETSHDSSHS